MDKDKIIQSLLRMLQNSNTEKINMQLTIDDFWIPQIEIDL